MNNVGGRDVCDSELDFVGILCPCARVRNFIELIVMNDLYVAEEDDNDLSTFVQRGAEEENDHKGRRSVAGI